MLPWHAARACARRGGSAFVALAFVASAIFGSAYFIWCVPMARAMTECCCHEAMAAHEPSAEQAVPNVAAVNAACCEIRHLAKLATALVLRNEAQGVQAPSWVLVSWAFASSLQGPPQLDLLTSQPARAGPPPPKIPQYLRIRTLLI
jgi:hypothetical protein